MSCNCNNNKENMMISRHTIDQNALIYDKIVLPTLSQLGKGVVGAAKAICNIGVLSIDIINKRRDICKSCEYNNRIDGYNQCMKCACVISLKTKLTKETCPIGKWDFGL